MTENNDRLDFQLDMYWSLCFKIAFSWALLMSCVIKIVTTIYERDIMLNRISLLPFYTTAAQSLMMIVYYTLFSVFDITNQSPYIYNYWRNLLGSGTCFCFCLIVFSMNTYGQLLHKLLIYQDKNQVGQANVYINEHFAAERKLVRNHKVLFCFVVLLIELLQATIAVVELVQGIDEDDKDYI